MSARGAYQADGTSTENGKVAAAARVAASLREQIITGELPPGTRLKDTYLAEAHQVSRNTVRDAVRELESDGLVISRRKAAAEERWSDLGTTSLRLHQGIVGLLGSPRFDAFFATIVAQLRLVFAVM